MMLIGISSQSGQTIHSQEFSGKQNCEIAKSVILQEFPKQHPTIYYSQCFLKSEKLGKIK